MNEEEFLREHISLMGCLEKAGRKSDVYLFYLKDIHQTQIDREKIDEVINSLLDNPNNHPQYVAAFKDFIRRTALGGQYYDKQRK